VCNFNWDKEKETIKTKGFKILLDTFQFVGISIVIQFFIYLRADSTAIGLLQSQHGHIQEKQWTAQRQCTKTT
jgi:hypothetical protein